MRPRPTRAPVAGACLGGASTGVAVLTGWWWLAIVGSAAIAAAVHKRSPRRRLFLGFAAGTVHVAATSLWVARFSVVGAVGLVALQAAGWGLAALVVSRQSRWPWALAPALATSEWARAHWPLGGYPLSQLWLTQADGPLAALAALVGPFGISAAIVLAGAAVVGVWERGRAAPMVLAGLVAAITVAAWLPVPAPIDQIEVAAVQGGDRRGVPAVRSDPEPLLERQFELTRGLASEVDLVVWPESAVASRGLLAHTDHERLRELADELDGTLITGLVERFDRADSPGWFRNAAIAVDETGLSDRYDKQLAVPFGERVPLRGLLERIIDLSLVPRDMLPGSGPPILRTGLADIGVAISYENLFPRIAREAVAQGAQFLVVPTLASSYVTDEIPTQQLAAARLRARETGRDLAIVGSTGPTALIRADGSLAEHAPLDVSHTITASLHSREGTTIAVRLGSIPVLTVSAAGLAAQATARPRRRRRDRATAGSNPLLPSRQTASPGSRRRGVPNNIGYAVPINRRRQDHACQSSR